MDNQIVSEAYSRCGGNVASTARELGLPRSTVWDALRRIKANVKPVCGGSKFGTKTTVFPLPAFGVKRYIVTAAQNNTKVNSQVWRNLVALAEYHTADILVGTFTYNQNAFSNLNAKAGTEKSTQDLWFAPEVTPYIQDKRIRLANGLVWCGEMNIIPTASDPLSGLETYSGRNSAIFPHAKIALRSIAAMKGQGVKFNYTTGCVTEQNYIQRTAGLKGEHTHSYGGLIVEITSNGNWWVRQIEADSRGRICDLDLTADRGVVTGGNRPEAITFGDLHATAIDPIVKKLSLEMLNELRPKFQFLHDLMEGCSVNHHSENDPHERFKVALRGLISIDKELVNTSRVLSDYATAVAGIRTVVVDSNHDNWLNRWLKEFDIRTGNPVNAIVYLEGQLATYNAMLDKDETFNLTKWAMDRSTVGSNITFLKADESFTIANGEIEAGMHGHLGINGSRGSPVQLSKAGRKANIGHTHVAGIWSGLFVAGTSSLLDMGYNKGLSGWSHSHIITYANGRRTIVTMYNGKWKA